MTLTETVKELSRCYGKQEDKLVYRVPIDLTKEPERPFNGYCALSDSMCPFYEQVKNNCYCKALMRKEE